MYGTTSELGGASAMPQRPIGSFAANESSRCRRCGGRLRNGSGALDGNGSGPADTPRVAYRDDAHRVAPSGGAGGADHEAVLNLPGVSRRLRGRATFEAVRRDSFFPAGAGAVGAGPRQSTVGTQCGVR